MPKPSTARVLDGACWISAAFCPLSLEKIAKYQPGAANPSPYRESFLRAVQRTSTTFHTTISVQNLYNFPINPKYSVSTDLSAHATPFAFAAL
jgi:hypothetical protein